MAPKIASCVLLAAAVAVGTCIAHSGVKALRRLMGHTGPAAVKTNFPFIAADPEYSTMVKLLDGLGPAVLTGTLVESTTFAPSDQGFINSAEELAAYTGEPSINSLAQNPTQINRMLGGIGIFGHLYSEEDLVDGLVVLNTAGDKLTVHVVDDNIYIQGPKNRVRYISTCRPGPLAVFHKVDGVLIPSI